MNAFLDRLQLDARLARVVPSGDRRVRLPYAAALGVLLRSILVECEPIYRQAEVVETLALSAFGLSAAQARYLTDDAVGRALEQLFDADCAALLTDVVVAAALEFEVRLDELHNVLGVGPVAWTVWVGRSACDRYALSVPPSVLAGCLVPEAGVEALPVVEDLDEVVDGRPELVAGAPVLAIEQFGLQGGVPRLDGGVVQGIPG